ncbi:MAG TPA: hypothetical protein VLH12_04920 [Usitatibacter sp.]|nr:hypothetical protein [Usitatibacter sp.]
MRSSLGVCAALGGPAAAHNTRHGPFARADKVAAVARAKGFADANVREMQVVLEHP